MWYHLSFTTPHLWSTGAENTGCNSSATENITQNSVVEVARQALQHIADIHDGGPIEPYLDMVTDDYTFYMPLGDFRGKNVGRDRAAECYRWIASLQPAFVYEPPERVTTHNNTVVFEFEDHGTLGGQPYHNRIAASFDVRGDKISSYREYMGDVDVELLGSAVNAGK